MQHIKARKLLTLYDHSDIHRLDFHATYTIFAGHIFILSIKDMGELVTNWLSPFQRSV